MIFIIQLNWCHKLVICCHNFCCNSVIREFSYDIFLAFNLKCITLMAYDFLSSFYVMIISWNFRDNYYLIKFMAYTHIYIYICVCQSLFLVNKRKKNLPKFLAKEYILYFNLKHITLMSYDFFFPFCGIMTKSISEISFVSTRCT